MDSFGELVLAFGNEIQSGPRWVELWVSFMGLVILLAVPFAFVRAEARWVVVAMLLTFPTMMFMYAQFGYQRILGLPHVIFWTPLLIYLWRRRSEWRVRETLAGKWIALLTLTVFISLIMDYADVVRYMMGERL